MLIIIHRVNTIEKLKEIPSEYGVEIDIRGDRDRMLLNHDPLDSGRSYDDLEDYLKVFSDKQQAFVIFNLKEAGYEKRIIELAVKYGLRQDQYFLLDVEFPYLYKASRRDGTRSIAVRFSEAEPIESVEAQIIDGEPLIDWVWIDVNTSLPLTSEIVDRLESFRTCLVCPGCWGRSDDIVAYVAKMKDLNFKPEAVMTDEENLEIWRRAEL